MDVDEEQSTKPEVTINITNIKENIPHRIHDGIININTSATSTPEKILPSRIISPDALLTSSDHGEELRSPPRTPDTPVQVLAKVNCPERIVICIDISSEMNVRRYRAKAGTPFSGMDIIKRSLKLFISNKQLISNRKQKHTFALVLLLDEALWLTDFTSDLPELFTQIDSLETLKEQGETFNMSTLFDLILEKAKLPKLNVIENTAPSHVVRVILVYGRSHCMPVFKTHEAQNLITGSPCYFMDIVYLHEPPSEENQSENIYQELCDLDTRGFSYIHEISKTPTKVFDAFGKLLAHPLQRPVQSQGGYRLEPLQTFPDADLM